MKKIVSYLVPVVAIILFIAIMLSGKYLKNPRNPSEDVVGFMQNTINHANEENWGKVEIDIMNLEKAWKKIEPRIQFSVERDELYNIDVNIARLKGSSISKDKSSTLIELHELLENWDELTR